jgi:hypothetical protein
MEDHAAQLLERQAIVDTVNRLFIATDQRDWPAVRACFAEEVLFDMTSVTGGEPSHLSATQITDGWEAGLQGLQAIHHQAGNHLVEVRGEEAAAFCYGLASHYLPRDPGGRRACSSGATTSTQRPADTCRSRPSGGCAPAWLAVIAAAYA